MPRHALRISAKFRCMTLEFFTRNWALVIASVLGTAILLFVSSRLYTDSPRGRLKRCVRALRVKQAAAGKTRRQLGAAQRRLAQLQASAASVKPRLVSAADEAVQDAQMLQKLADDQVLIAIKHVREVILEEFPPNRHDVLRNKYL